MVRDADELDNGLFSEQDSQRDEDGQEDALDGVNPFDAIVCEAELEDEPGRQRPEKQRKVDLQSGQHVGILASASADNAAKEHEDGWKNVGD